MVDEIKVPAKAPKKRTKKKITAPAAMKLPTAEAIEDARQRRKRHQTEGRDPPGTIYGLPDGWVGAVIDPSLSAGQIARHDALWTAKGWVKLEGLHACSGYHSGAIVYVKTREDYEQARLDRANKQKEDRANGLRF